ncbi:Transcription initiation factor IIE, alpha subunit [Trachipleistophora hominis]|uniref:Transcription initiation factor IIE, alpha subunit n=1 Tax=Trachipleistophora hominis TaxID=72359 RepID=L7JTP8_TRAHO|nr:Transcription initiation factor IIE, alpha subunit [Trachipleistophora hominis]
MDMSYEPLMQKLIRHTLRLFYQPHHCVIMDILSEKLLLRENEICSAMKMLSKEFNKLIVKLKEDKLIKQESKIETTIDGRQLLQQIYYIDYREIKDIIKYKIYKMSTEINEHLREQQRQIGYVCSECKTEYSVLEAQSLVKNYRFICPDCNIELVENKNTEVDPHELHTLMMNDLKDIIDMLKQADNYNIPTIDYFQALEMKKNKEAKTGVVVNKTDDNMKEIDDAADTKGYEASYTFGELSEIDKEMATHETVSGEEPGNVVQDEISVRKDECFVTDKSLEEEIFLNTTRSDDLEKSEPRPADVHDEIMVKVGGVAKVFSAVTEEDKEKMTEEEYETYFEVFLKQNE